LGRVPVNAEKRQDELVVEPLLQDRLLVRAGAGTRWARGRKIELEELADEPWVLTRPDCWTHDATMEAFRARGIKPPRVTLTTSSIPLRLSLAATGRYITVVASFERSLGAYRMPVKVLSVDVREGLSPLMMVTLKDRVLNPLALSFIDHVRSYAASQRRQFAP